MVAHPEPKTRAAEAHPATLRNEAKLYPDRCCRPSINHAAPCPCHWAPRSRGGPRRRSRGHRDGWASARPRDVGSPGIGDPAPIRHPPRSRHAVRAPHTPRPAHPRGAPRVRARRRLRGRQPSDEASTRSSSPGPSSRACAQPRGRGRGRARRGGLRSPGPPSRSGPAFTLRDGQAVRTDRWGDSGYGKGWGIAPKMSAEMVPEAFLMDAYLDLRVRRGPCCGPGSSSRRPTAPGATARPSSPSGRAGHRPDGRWARCCMAAPQHFVEYNLAAFNGEGGTASATSTASCWMGCRRSPSGARADLRGSPATWSPPSPWATPPTSTASVRRARKRAPSATTRRPWCTGAG